ncbi:Aste57867_22943 [Aphanomyces stellatus]|uniref:HECT-type E3 ubiquitin transferase n=1 Tax=Aphanomyces stellatus TaxID=120398 RepID=A0A485LLW5_9STRA|nr:hypothetical protein As57867_022872 [Aphanomyces stellatus]VFT99593.1 Aste57867_22943 [Aphanomyces stellatus]
MGGRKSSSKEQSKEEFLAAAREERAQRAQTRLFQVTSVKLQAWYRGCRTRTLTRLEFQQTVTAKCNDISALQRLYTFTVPLPVLTRLVQETLYVQWPQDTTVPLSVLEFVQQSWSVLQKDWTHSPAHKSEWSVRLASLCALVSQLSLPALASFVPAVTDVIPETLHRWALRPSPALFDAVVLAYQSDRALYDILAPRVWTLVESHGLHAKLATTLLSVPLSAQEPQLKAWLDRTVLHVPLSTTWLASTHHQAIVLGNLLDLLHSSPASDGLVALVTTYTSQTMVDMAFLSSSPLQLLANHAVLSKLWTSSSHLASVTQLYAHVLLSLDDDSPFVSAILFAVSSGDVLGRLFDLLQPAALSPAWLVFCAAFGHLLHTADAASLARHFSDLPALVAKLNQSLHAICWQDAVPPATLAHTAQLTHMIQVFNQLHLRHARQSLCPQTHWLWPTIALPPDILQGLDVDEPLTVKVLFESNARVKLQYILTTIPQVIPFEARVGLFHAFLVADKQSVPSRHVFSSLVAMRIQRDRIVQDSFKGFSAVQSLKGRVQITFINEQGLEEAGVDGGGVFKEYIDNLTKTAFSTEFPFFLETDERLLYPNPHAPLAASSLWDSDNMGERAEKSTAYFRFLGRVLAKAMYEEILIEPQFALFFLQKLLGHTNSLDDLQSLDAQLYHQVMKLKQYADVESLGLTFSVASGPNIVHDLIPGGRNVAVTNDNVIRYSHLLAHYKLNVQIAPACRAFLEGFHDLIPIAWLHLFSPSELQMLIGGSTYDVNLTDWQANTNYGGGYHPSQPIIQWFWEIVAECTPEQRGDLLRFITSCSRQPLLGFKQLVPLICIQQVRIQDDERLPSSATCMNLLKLPTYSSKEIMRAKLLYAIQAKAGFELS